MPVGVPVTVRMVLCLVLVCLLGPMQARAQDAAAPVPAGGVTPAEPGAGPDPAAPAVAADVSMAPEFEALLSRVRDSDPSVDFGELRRLYAESPTYAVWADELERDLVAAAASGAYDDALRIARDILNRNYLNLEAHFAGAVACEGLADRRCADHHVYVARGILGSVQATGDGTSMASAFMVVATQEEYALARIRGFDVVQQELVRADDGHFFDALRVRSIDTGDERVIYFNVDAVIAAMRRVIRPQ